MFDSPYFHVIFTLLYELNLLVYCNKKILYGLHHRCCADTILELSLSKKYLDATPGIIQVLHTWKLQPPTAGFFLLQNRKPFFSQKMQFKEPQTEELFRKNEFIRHFLIYVLPLAFQKIRYYGFLNSRMKSKNLKLIYRLEGYQRVKRHYADLSLVEVLKAV